MPVVERTVTVRFTLDGYHSWPGAFGARAYLADRHRHRFGFAVTVPVEHHDREVEFHDLLDEVQRVASGLGTAAAGGGIDFGGRSCEFLAERLGEVIAVRTGRQVTCQVDEDGYVTATVKVEP